MPLSGFSCIDFKASLIHIVAKNELFEYLDDCRCFVGLEQCNEGNINNKQICEDYRLIDEWTQFVKNLYPFYLIE